MISIKSLFKSSMIYGIGSAFMRAMTFLLLPFYTNELENYGEFVLVMTTIAFLRICYSHGMGDSFLKKYSESESKQKITSTYLIYILFIIVVVSSLFILLNKIIYIENPSSLMGLLQTKLMFIICIVLFDTLNYRIIDILRIKNYASYYMFGQIVGVITTFSLTLYLVNTFNQNTIIPFLKDEVECALFAVVCGAGLTFCVFSPILFQNLKFNKFSKKHLKSMISLSLRFFPAALFFMFMELLDRYLLKILLEGPNANDLIGTYSVGCKLASVPMLLISAFNLGWQPFYLNNGNNKKAITQYAKVGNIFIIIMLSVSWLVSIAMPLIAQMNIPFIDNYPIIGPTFVEGIKIIPFILMSHIFYALYIINMPPIYLCDKQNWSPILRIFGAVTNIILNIILIPIYGIYGAAIATAAGYGLMFLLLFYKNREWMPIQLSWGTILPLFLIISGSTILQTTSIGIFVAFFTLCYIIIILYKNGLNQLSLLFK